MAPITQRICPQCRQQTEAKQCPHDGYGTVPAHLYGKDDSNDPLIGQVFEERYRIESLIGKGGFGAVYRATQLVVDRPVALKVLHKNVAQDLEQVRRFQQEARAASRLEHHHSVRLHDFGQTEDGVLFLVTELLEGEPLSKLMKRERPIPAERAVGIACQALEALAEAHDAGLVHRDLKPDNLFLKRTRSGKDFVKVLDFGIAKLTGDGDMSALTKTGMVMGTPTYMSPEQARARPVDARSDLYSMGVLLYEMLSGVRPFTGSTPMEILLGHIQTPAPRVAPRPGLHVPTALVALVQRCLEKDPGKRPQTADELRELLQASLRSDVGAEASSAPASAGRAPIPVGVLLADPRDPEATVAMATPEPSAACHGATMPMPTPAGTALPPSTETTRAPAPVLEEPEVRARRGWVWGAVAVAAIAAALLLVFRPWASEPDQPGESPNRPVTAVDTGGTAAGEASPVSEETAKQAKMAAQPAMAAIPAAVVARPAVAVAQSAAVVAQPAAVVAQPAAVERTVVTRDTEEALVRARLPLVLEAAAVVKPAGTRVLLESKPEKATVWEDKTKLGKTPLTVDLQPTGARVLKLGKAGWISQQVRLEAGETGTKDIVLKPRPKPVTAPATFEVKVR